MKNNLQLHEAAFQLDGKMPLRQAIPLGLQHVLAMFVGNLTPLLIITGACGLAGGEFADLQLSLLQNAMLMAGVVTLVQLFSIGPVGGKVPIVMGTSSGFIGVFNSVAATMGGGVIAYGAIMGASIIGGLFETVLGFFLKPLRKFFPAVVTGTVVMSIPGKPVSGGVRAGDDSDLQTRYQRLHQLFFHPSGHCLRLSGGLSHGSGPADHRRCRRRHGVCEGLGAELGQDQRSVLV